MGFIYKGREPIYTSVLPKHLQFKKFYGDTLDDSTMHIVLDRALRVHYRNRLEINKLLDYYKGIQDILYRYEGDDENKLVDNRIVINYANSFTRKIKSYVYGNPIQYAPNDQKFMADVQALGKALNAENKPAVTDMMADYQSICGTAYIGILPDVVMPDEVPFELITFNPQTTFRVYSEYNSSRPVYACTFNTFEDLNGDRYTVYNVYTDRIHYIYKTPEGSAVNREHLLEVEPNPIGSIPIVEYMNNQFRMGDWEMAISLMNAINSTASDSINDIQQTVLSYLVILGAEMSEEAFEAARKYRMFSLHNTKGVNPDVKFITSQIDGQSAQLLRAYLEEALRVVVGIPNRDERTSGGDTGVAAITRTGTADLEDVAKIKTSYTRMAEQELISIAIELMKAKGMIGSDISVADIDIGFNRCKTDNLLVKTQAGMNLFDMGVDIGDITAIMNLTTDNVGFSERWRKNAEEQRQREMDSEIKLKNESEGENIASERTGQIEAQG